jgi:hypothetical protein
LEAKEVKKKKTKSTKSKTSSREKKVGSIKKPKGSLKALTKMVSRKSSKRKKGEK